MAFEGCPAYVFNATAIYEGAPARSGVFALFTHTKWVYINDASNMRQALFDLYNASDERIESHQPLSFSCEEVDASERRQRRDLLVTELRPVCNIRDREIVDQALAA